MKSLVCNLIKTFKDNRKRVGSQHKKKKVEQPLSVPLAPLRLEPLTQNREAHVIRDYDSFLLFDNDALYFIFAPASHHLLH